MGSSQTTTQRADPWEPAGPFILEGLHEARDMWNSDPNQFVIDPWRGDAIAGMSDATYNATKDMSDLANQQRAHLMANQQNQTNLTNSASANINVNPFTQGVAQAQGMGQDPHMTVGLDRASNAPSQVFTNQMEQQAYQGQPGSVANAVSGAQGARTSNHFNTAVNTNMNAGADTRFNDVMYQMTGDGYDDQLRSALRQNTMESVMPGVNQTFAGQGMTGSSLHQAGLSKALASGMSANEAAFLDKAQNRKMQAAMMAQQGHEQTLGRLMNAGQADEAARANLRNQSMAAAGIDLQGLGLRNDTNFRAANALQNESNVRDERLMRAGQMSADDSYRRAGLGLEAGTRAQDAYADNQKLAMHGTGLAPAVNDAIYNPLRTQLEAGQLLDDRNNTQVAADIMAHQQAQAGPIDALNNYMALTSGLGGQFGSSMANVQNNPGLLGMLGLGTQGLGLLQMLSDRRAKEAIKRVGTLDNGLPVYTYRYKGGDVTQMGVMAQDVQQVIPDAVVKGADGFLRVRYDMLGDV